MNFYNLRQDIIDNYNLPNVESWYWVEHNNDLIDICYDCAIEYIKKNNLDELDDIDGGWCCESDSPQFCVECGVKLDYELTIYGVEAEIKHFETHGIKTPDDLLSFTFVLEGLEHVEKFPFEYMDKDEQDYHQSLYIRALALNVRWNNSWTSMKNSE